MCDVKEIVHDFEGREIVKHIRKYNLGVDRKDCQFVNIELAERKRDPEEDYYYYDGPRDKKNRPFCHDMLEFDKVLTLSEINFLSRKLRYNVLLYKGSYGCRHEWVTFRGKVIYTPPLTPNQSRVLTSRGQPYNDGISNPKSYTNY